jgi:hypothetical protein
MAVTGYQQPQHIASAVAGQPAQEGGEDGDQLTRRKQHGRRGPEDLRRGGQQQVLRRGAQGRRLSSGRRAGPGPLQLQL